MAQTRGQATALDKVVIGVGLLPWASGLFVGWMPTALASMTLESWTVGVAARLLWQWGGVALAAGACALLIARHSEPGRRLRYASIAAAGLATMMLPFAWAPVLDAITGPQVVEGVLVASEVDRGHRSIRARVTIEDAAGETITMTLRGWQANRWVADAAPVCPPGSQVALTRLRFLDVPLALRCGP